MSLLGGGGVQFSAKPLEAESDAEVSLNTSSATLAPQIIKRWTITKSAGYLAQQLRYISLILVGETVLDNALGEIALGWIYSTNNGATWNEWFRTSHSNAAYTAGSEQDADPVSGFPSNTTDIAFALYNRFDAADGRGKHLKGQVLLMLPLGYTVTPV